jgi:hypothetical protein
MAIPPIVVQGFPFPGSQMFFWHKFSVVVTVRQTASTYTKHTNTTDNANTDPCSHLDASSRSQCWRYTHLRLKSDSVPATCRDYISHYVSSTSFKLTTYCSSYHLMSTISEIQNVAGRSPWLQIFVQHNQRTYLNGIVHSHRKTEKVFWQLEMFDVCTTGDTAHIDTIFKFLPHTRQHGCIDIIHSCNDPWCLHRTSLVVEKTFFSFPVAVNSSTKVGPLVFLL